MDFAKHIQLQTVSESTTFPAYLLVMRVYWLLGSSVQEQARPDGERASFPACQHRLVGVLSDVVNSRLILEQGYFHVMEKLLVWLVFLPLSIVQNRPIS